VQVGDAIRRCHRGADVLVTPGRQRHSQTVVHGGDEVDVIAVYCHDVDQCYLLQLDHFDGRKQFDLRLAPSRNNQRLRVNWASEFEFEATLECLLGP
jgi:PD-(D/E)XK endonuclease